MCSSAEMREMAFSFTESKKLIYAHGGCARTKKLGSFLAYRREVISSLSWMYVNKWMYVCMIGRTLPCEGPPRVGILARPPAWLIGPFAWQVVEK